MSIEFRRSFRKRYRKIPLKVRRQFDERLRLFAREPFHPILNNHPLTGERNGQWSMNVTGDWRAIYVPLAEGRVVFIDIDTHSNLYE